MSSANPQNGQFESTLSQLEAGIRYYTGHGVAQDYDKAFELLREVVSQTSVVVDGMEDSELCAQARYYFALMYLHGQGVERDVTQALIWLEAAAQLGHIKAYRKWVVYSEMSLNPSFNPIDGEIKIKKTFHGVNEIVKNYLDSLILDYKLFRAKAGLSGSLGEDTKSEEQFQEGHQVIQEQANNGDDEAQYNLGMLYYHGKYVEQNFKQAFFWLKKAANQGNNNAQSQLILMCENGEGVEQSLPLARYWLETWAAQGYEEMQRRLFSFDAELLLTASRCFMDNEDYKDYKKGLFILQYLANQNLITVKESFRLAYLQAQGINVMPSNGNYVEEDKVYRVIRRYVKVMYRAHQKARFELGMIYYSGQYDIAQDYHQAFAWFKKAAMNGAIQGHKEAQYYLGVMYQNGYGVTQNSQQAFYWVERAAQGNPIFSIDAQYHLGVMYQNGYGVAQDLQKARYWWEQAAKRRHQQARQMLSELE